MVLKAVLGPRFELVERPAGFGHSDYGKIESLIANQSLQRGEYLLISQISSGAEKHERIGHFVWH